MTVVKFPDTALSIRPTGALGGYKIWIRGEKTYAELLAENQYAGIYQTRPSEKGRYVVKMPFYRPTNPQTVEQQAWRAVFAGGVIAYHALTPIEKGEYTVRAKRNRMSAFNVYMSDYLREHRI